MGLIVSNALPSGYQGLSLEANPSSLISAAGGWMNAANGSACHVSWTSVFPVGSGIYKPNASWEHHKVPSHEHLALHCHFPYPGSFYSIKGAFLEPVFC